MRVMHELSAAGLENLAIHPHVSKLSGTPIDLLHGSLHQAGQQTVCETVLMLALYPRSDCSVTLARLFHSRRGISASSARLASAWLRSSLVRSRSTRSRYVFNRLSEVCIREFTAVSISWLGDWLILVVIGVIGEMGARADRSPE